MSCCEGRSLEVQEPVEEEEGLQGTLKTDLKSLRIRLGEGEGGSVRECVCVVCVCVWCVCVETQCVCVFKCVYCIICITSCGVCHVVCAVELPM